MDCEEADKSAHRKYVIGEDITFDDGTIDTPENMRSVKTSFRPASERSLKFMCDLVLSRDVAGMLPSMPTAWVALLQDMMQTLHDHGPYAVHGMSKYAQSDVSTFIDQLKKQPVLKLGPKQNTNVELQDGIYKHHTGHIYKLYHTQKGIQVAKRLLTRTKPCYDCVDGTCDLPAGHICYEAEWKYEGKAPLAFIKPESRFNLEQAMEFGAIYGECALCGRELTNELSIALGIGPVCGNREFGGEFTFILKAKKSEMGL